MPRPDRQPQPAPEPGLDQAQPAAPPAERRDVGRAVYRVPGGTWFFVSFVNLTIWGIVCVATASWVYPWWLWVAGPWGAVLLASWLTGIGRRT